MFYIGDSSCLQHLDLVFLLDGSRSIELHGKGNFRRELNFTKQIIDAFRIGEGRVRASVLLFSTEPTLVFGLDKFKAKEDIFKAIDAIKFPAAGSDLGKALKLIQSEAFDFSTPSTSRIVVILTDGKAKDEVKQPSQALKKKGVHVLIVGVGDNLDIEQLETVASEPKDDSIFDFDKLSKLVDRISKDVCEGIGKVL